MKQVADITKRPADKVLTGLAANVDGYEGRATHRDDLLR
jgi:hypothetical protein